MRWDGTAGPPGQTRSPLLRVWGFTVALTFRDERPAEPSGDPGGETHRAAAREWATELVAALARCDRLDATMVGLVYFRGFTYHRVADQLEVPLSRVHSGVARGLQRIGRALTDGPR